MLADVVREVDEPTSTPTPRWSKRHDAIVLLLTTMADAAESYGWRSTGEGGPHLMPSMWHEGSYAELERRLRQMQEEERYLWWHVSKRWRWCERRVLVLPVVRQRGIATGVQLPKRSELIRASFVSGDRTARCIVRVWDAGVDEKKARDGVKWLLPRMRGTVRLPKILNVA